MRVYIKLHLTIAQNDMVSNGTYSPPMIRQEDKDKKSSCYQHTV